MSEFKLLDLLESDYHVRYHYLTDEAAPPRTPNHQDGVERMIVCSCFGVCSTRIQRIIEEGADSLADVGAACGAGTDCGSCRSQIREFIAVARIVASERRPESSTPAYTVVLADAPFDGW